MTSEPRRRCAYCTNLAVPGLPNHNGWPVCEQHASSENPAQAVTSHQALAEEIELAIASAVPCEVGVHTCKHILAADAIMPIIARELAARDDEIGRLRSQIVELQHQLAEAIVRGWR